MTTENQNAEVKAGTEPIVEFEARAVAVLATIVPKQDIRYYLNGIMVRPAPAPHPGVIIAATDGHRLAVWHDINGRADSERIFKVSPGLIAACKSATKRAARVRLEAGRLVVYSPVGEEFVQAGKCEIDGKYPDVFKVIPPNDKLVPGLRGAMNPLYLKGLGEIGKALGRGNGGYMASPSHYSHGEDGTAGIVTLFYGVENLLVVTMPMRIDGYPLAKPVPPVFVVKKDDEKKPGKASAKGAAK